MKATFVKSWNSSVQPRKQRKFRYNAPLHIRGEFVSVHLSKDLRKKYGTRAIRARKGDKVKIMRGQHKGKVGKIEDISLKFSEIYITGIEHVRKDGTKNLIPFNPSKLMITELDTSDKRRFSIQGNAQKKDKSD